MIKSARGRVNGLPPEGVPGVTELPSCLSGPSRVFHLRALLIPPRLPEESACFIEYEALLMARPFGD